MFSLGVDTAGGKSIAVYELEPQTTIDELKAKIEASEGIDVARQKLLAQHGGEARPKTFQRDVLGRAVVGQGDDS